MGAGIQRWWREPMVMPSSKTERGLAAYEVAPLAFTTLPAMAAHPIEIHIREFPKPVSLVMIFGYPEDI